MNRESLFLLSSLVLLCLVTCAIRWLYARRRRK